MFYCCVYFAEALKIIVLQQDFCSLIHSTYVWIEVMSPNIIFYKRAFLQNHPINIRSASCTESCMCVGSDFSYRIDRYVLRQYPIDCPKEFVPINILFRFKVTNLHTCMHTRIRTATAHDGDWRSEVGRKTSFQSFLNGKCIFLNLPAMIARAFVADVQEISFAFTHTAAKILFPIKSRSKTCFPW